MLLKDMHLKLFWSTLTL